MPDCASMLIKVATITAQPVVDFLLFEKAIMQAAHAQPKKAAELGAIKMPGVRAGIPGNTSPNTGGI